MKAKLNTTIPETLRAIFRQSAREQGRSEANLLRMLIENYCAKLGQGKGAK